MKIQIVAIGKSKNNAAYNQLIFDYIKQLTCEIQVIECEAPKSPKSSAIEVIKSEEKLLEKYLSSCNYIALDKSGIQLKSEEIASSIKDMQINRTEKIVFVIGGAYGLSQAIIKNAKMVISFGKHTMAHMLARLVLVEQIYRAFSIINSHPYHK